jgi:hypothetical protein
VRRRWATPPFSVARHCVRLASCPVVVVPPPALAREGGTRALRRAVSREAERYAEAGGAPKSGSPQRRRGSARR